MPRVDNQWLGARGGLVRPAPSRAHAGAVTPKILFAHLRCRSNAGRTSAKGVRYQCSTSEAAKSARQKTKCSMLRYAPNSVSPGNLLSWHPFKHYLGSAVMTDRPLVRMPIVSLVLSFFGCGISDLGPSPGRSGPRILFRRFPRIDPLRPISNRSNLSKKKACRRSHQRKPKAGAAESGPYLKKSISTLLALTWELMRIGAVLEDRDPSPVRRFGVFTSDLARCAIGSQSA